jgi:hypothetical protein
MTSPRSTLARAGQTACKGIIVKQFLRLPFALGSRRLWVGVGITPGPNRAFSMSCTDPQAIFSWRSANERLTIGAEAGATIPWPRRDAA